MKKKYKATKPVYYKTKKKSEFNSKIIWVFLGVIFLILGAYLIKLSVDRFEIIRKKPSENAVLKIPPTPAILSNNEGYLEEAFVENPVAFEYSDPKNFSFKTHIMDAGEVVSQYNRQDSVMFGKKEDYSVLDGITTFKGDNFRSSATFGTARITDAKMNILWIKKLESFDISGPFDGTAQPLIVQWPSDLMDIVKFRHGKKDKVQLTEVIFADKSGRVYFMDIDDGELTRAIMPTIGYTEGTPSLDPRGYPLLYVGQTIQEDGDTYKSRYQFFYIFDLIRQKQVFRLGSSSVEPFADSKWQGYGASPLVTDDTVMIPGESGVLYTFKIDANFDKQSNEITINSEPEVVKYKYENMHTGYAEDLVDEEGKRIPREIENGTAGSLVGYKNYVFLSEKSGFIQCIDINTMQLVYIVDLKGAGDFTLSIDEAENVEDGFYLYSGTRLDFAPIIENEGEVEQEEFVEPESVYFRKVDGRSGKILWENEYLCNVDGEVRGGIINSAIIGKNDLSEYIIYAVSGADNSENTKLICVRKIDGTTKWEKDLLTKAKSSPIEIYDKQGKGYIVFCGLDGNVSLFDGQSAEMLHQIVLEDGIDGSPAIYGSRMVVHLENDTLVCVNIK